MSEADTATQYRFDQGTKVGELAREKYPDGLFIDAPCWEVDRAINDTTTAIKANKSTVLFECTPSYIADGAIRF